MKASLRLHPGPPYNNQSGRFQKIFFTPQSLIGVLQPVSAAQDFVIGQLSALVRTDPAVATPLAVYKAASAAQQLKWANAYATAVTKVKFTSGSPVVPAAGDRPV